jgi:hypothetical protein
MKEEIKAAVGEAIAPLKQDIETLKAQLAALAPLAKLVKAAEPLQAVVEVQAVLKGIPKDTLAALKVVNVAFDGKAPWMSLVRADGTSVSVKKTDTAFRVRHRDRSGKLLKELHPPFNGLDAALKSLASPTS